MTSVGQSIPRVDAPAKVTGAARYVDDLRVPGALYGATVRSPVAHGVLHAITLDPAFDWTDVTVATAADLPGKNCVRLEEDDQPALVAVGGEIRHAAEPVALVAAPTRQGARDAVAHVRLDIEPLPAVFDVENADARRVLRDLHVGHGDVDAAFAAADVVIDGVYRTGPAEHSYLEPQGMLARWDNLGVLHVIGSLQCPYFVERALAPAFALEPDEIDVAQATTGGGFGGKEEYPSMVAVHAALLARRAGRPVKLVYPRGEDIAATTKRHPAVIRHRLAATRDGTLLAADVDLVLDAGAYVTLSPVVLLRAMLHAAGPYRVPNVRVRGRAVMTNTPPSGAFRGFGAPQALFAAERQMAKLARAIGADPIALRRANALRPGDTTSTGGTLDASAGLADVLDALEARLASESPHARPLREGPAHRGRGIAVGFHGSGFTGNGESVIHATATVERVGTDRFRVLTSLVDMGQGARTVLTQLAADALGVEVSQVDVPEPSTAATPNTGPTVASRSTLIGGTVVTKAAARLRDDPTLDAATETYELPSEVLWDQDSLSGDAYPTYAWSAVALDVAVDDDTSEVTVERCVHVVDAGHAINPLAVQGQVEGGTLQALGWALWEHVERVDGAIPRPSMSTTVIPTSADAPEIETVVVEVPFVHGPAGAKGIGELPMDATPPAAANAIEDALGVAVDEIPALPEVLHRLRGEPA